MFTHGYRYVFMVLHCHHFDGAFIVVLSLSASKVKPTQWFGFCLMVLALTSAGYLLLKQTPLQPIQAEIARMMTSRDIMDEIQQQLKQEPNNDELWFQLGQGYLLEENLMPR